MATKPAHERREPGRPILHHRELVRYDGVDGRQCLVAVDGDVYLTEGFAL